MPKKGYKQSEEHKRKLSGRIPWNKDSKGLQTRVKIQDFSGNKNGMYGKHQTEETKQKMSDNHWDCSGEKNGMYGKHQTEETKQKISENHADISGENHPDFRGNKNPNWKGGISFEPYCKDFNNVRKEKIRNRDGRICQECDKTEIKNGRKLTCHHIHYDKPNCDPDLIALCISCNVKSNYNRDYWEEHFMKKLRERDL